MKKPRIYPPPIALVRALGLKPEVKSAAKRGALESEVTAELHPATVLPAPLAPSRLLSAAEFQRLADVPPEIEWFANLGNKSTRRAYENALQDFMQFTGIARPEEFRDVTRAHVIAWRDDLVRRALSGMTVRHRLAALSSLFEYLCEKNAVPHNPVKGVKRPPIESYEGKTPALGDHQARVLLDAPREPRPSCRCPGLRPLAPPGRDP